MYREMFYFSKFLGAKLVNFSNIKSLQTFKYHSININIKNTNLSS